MLVGCAGVLIAAAGFVADVPETLRARLEATNEVAGAFVQTKTAGSDGRVYVTKGTYRIRPGADFEWRTTDPFETRFYATPTNYVYSNEDETVSRPLKDLPGLSRVPVPVKGDYSAFFRAFDALYREDRGKFYVKAKPKSGDLRRALARVDAEGTVSNWTLTVEFPDRTVFRLDFTDR